MTDAATEAKRARLRELLERRARRPRIVPASRTQEHVWFHQQLEPTSALYHLAAHVRIHGALEADVLERSVVEIARRHETLRTTLVTVDELPVQRIAPEPAPTLARVDLAPLDPTARDAALSQLEQTVARAPFDLATGPLLRTTLVALGPSEHALLVVLHHAVGDGISLSVLVHELAVVYPALLAATVPSLPPLSVQYADYVAWQRDFVASEACARHVDFWRDTLADAPSLSLPTDRPRTRAGSFAGGEWRSGVPSGQLARIDAIARGAGCTRFMALLAAYVVVLGRHAGQTDVTVATAVAGRTRPELAPLIGSLANVLVLRVDLADDPPFVVAMTRVRDALQQAFAHEDVPFEHVVHALRSSRSAASAPLYHAMCVFHGGHAARVELPGGPTLVSTPIAAGASRCDLTLDLYDALDGLTAGWEYATALFDADTIARIARHYGALLAGVAADPTRAVSQLPWSSDVDRAFIESLARTPRTVAAPGALDAEAGVFAREAHADLVRTLGAIWRAVLGTGEPAAGDDFFAQGGHSLRAAQFAARASQALGVDVPTRMLFDAPTFGALARRIGARLGDDGVQTATQIVPVPRDRRLALSFAQERWWFLAQLAPDSAAYHVTGAVRLQGVLEADALVRAFDALTGRHEVLRSSFVSVDGTPTLRVEPTVRVDVLREDLRDEDPVKRAAQLEARFTAFAMRPFDLSTAPLLRASLVRVGDDEHVLCLVMHHVVSDGWSLSLVVRELAALYAAQRDASSPSLAPLPVQYADWAAWQRGEAHAAALDAQRAYWVAQLRGAPGTLDLPTDRSRPAVRAMRGRRVEGALSEALAARVHAVAHEHGATTFMLLWALWATLLARHASASDVVVGAPVAGRDRVETEALIGCFINLVALRITLDGAPDLVALLTRARATTLGAFEHDALPFEQVVDALHIPRDLSRTPVFQTVFVLQNTPSAPLVARELTLTPLDVPPVGSRYDLAIEAREEAGVKLALTFDPDLFDDETAAFLLQRFVALVTDAVASPSRPLARLAITDASERARVLAWARGPDAVVPSTQSLLARIAAHAARTPDAIACHDGAVLLPFGALLRRVERLAAVLCARGIAPGARVAVAIDRGADLLIALLAVWHAGAAFVPVDPAWPVDRVAHVLDDCGATAILVRDETEVPTGSRVQAIAVGATLDVAATAIDPPDESLAYVIYTSGSTGRPKGVGVSHRSLARHLDQVERDVLRGRPVAATTRPSFDAALKQLVAPLVYGRAVWFTVAATRDVASLADELSHRDDAVFNAVPALWDAVLTVLESRPSLRGPAAVLLGGEAVSEGLLSRTRARLPDIELWNLYGPTETTVNAAATRLEHGVAVTLGRPIAGATLYVLDAFGEPVPQGALGELYIGGDGVAHGYIRQPARTAERFVPDPFDGRPGRRMYRSGDTVRWTRGGTLAFHGRRDHQVKVRGLRVELGEIEAVLSACPHVREAVVLVQTDATTAADARLVGYVVADAPAAVTASTLRSFARARLPDYMVPVAYGVLEAWPRTSGGKIDRAALPAIALDDRPADRPFVAPTSPLEITLAGIWARVLGIARVGARDHFFEDLGGHSLLAVRVVAAIERETGRRVPVTAMFQSLTVEALARQMDAPRAATTPDTSAQDWAARRRAALQRTRRGSGG